MKSKTEIEKKTVKEFRGIAEEGEGVSALKKERKWGRKTEGGMVKRREKKEEKWRCEEEKVTGGT